MMDARVVVRSRCRRRSIACDCDADDGSLCSGKRLASASTTDATEAAPSVTGVQWIPERPLVGLAVFGGGLQLTRAYLLRECLGA
jgi:hypothetical protein